MHGFTKTIFTYEIPQHVVRKAKMLSLISQPTMGDTTVQCTD